MEFGYQEALSKNLLSHLIYMLTGCEIMSLHFKMLKLTHKLLFRLILIIEVEGKLGNSSRDKFS